MLSSQRMARVVGLRSSTGSGSGAPCVPEIRGAPGQDRQGRRPVRRVVLGKDAQAAVLVLPIGEPAAHAGRSRGATVARQSERGQRRRLGGWRRPGAIAPAGFVLEFVERCFQPTHRSRFKNGEGIAIRRNYILTRPDSLDQVAGRVRIRPLGPGMRRFGNASDANASDFNEFQKFCRDNLTAGRSALGFQYRDTHAFVVSDFWGLASAGFA